MIINLTKFLSINVDVYDNNLDSLETQINNNNVLEIIIKDVPYKVISIQNLKKYKSKIDEYYRLLYIQINKKTFEYYIGKVNRPKYSEILRYQGSGIRFRKSYHKHKKDFVRFFIATCESQKDTENLESIIVDDELLTDKKCLNLVSGGAGTNEHPTSEETKIKLHNYMLEHPEQSEAMFKHNKILYSSGNTEALRERNNKIKNTMTKQKYREMSSKRINNWKLNKPEAYAISRLNNKLSIQNEDVKHKRNHSLEKWRKENPEKYLENRKKLTIAATSISANKKRSNSIKEWMNSNPIESKENTIKRAEASKKVCSKPVNMINIETDEIILTFECQKDAARWLVQNGKAKNTNCVVSISAVCRKKPCKYGYRKQAYGYKWEFTNNQNEKK